MAVVVEEEEEVVLGVEQEGMVVAEYLAAISICNRWVYLRFQQGKLDNFNAIGFLLEVQFNNKQGTSHYIVFRLGHAGKLTMVFWLYLGKLS